MSTATQDLPTGKRLSKQNRRVKPARNGAVRQRQHTPTTESASSLSDQGRKTAHRGIDHKSGRTSPQSSRSTAAPKQRSSDPAFEPNEGFHFTLAHAFVVFGYIVGFSLFAVFGLDLLLEIPFQRGSIMYDVANVVGGLTLMYLSWNCQRDLR